MTTKITNSNYNELANSGKPVLIDFSAAWCGPCKMLAPTIAKLATEFEGRAVVAKVDIDEEPELQAKFRVMSVPSVFLIKDGKVVETAVGVRPIDVYQKMINDAL